MAPNESNSRDWENEKHTRQTWLWGSYWHGAAAFLMAAVLVGLPTWVYCSAIEISGSSGSISPIAWAIITTSCSTLLFYAVLRGFS